MNSAPQEKLVVFRQKEIRRQLHGGEWWFVITDVIAVLTDSVDPTQYLKRLRQRDSELALLFYPQDKGGYKLYPPLHLPSIHLVASKSYFPGIRKAYFGLSSLSLVKRQSRLKSGWPRLGMNGCKKLKIQNWHKSE